MADEKKTPADDNEDPADAFARVGSDEIPPNDPKPSKPKKSGGKKVREPIVEKPSTAVTRIVEDDEGMDPFDAAEEIVGMLDQLMAVAVSLRSYDRILMPDGTTPLLTVVMPTEKAKERQKKAVARMLRSTGAQMSPGVGLAFTTFMCYGAPIITMEIARASAKPIKAP